MFTDQLSLLVVKNITQIIYVKLKIGLYTIWLHRIPVIPIDNFFPVRSRDIVVERDPTRFR